ncbi:hypothetical protein D0Q02_08835 [Micromonospora craniellae]|uniref:DUF559 domain-containing protein n=1 Tax=Micromonospora craniellae TaxID=2294034 RepID=A0A372G1F6_9ACTN|nr:hypothetical protein D0Q02_08835 [Micromonospora craniellae]
MSSDSTRWRTWPEHRVAVEYDGLWHHDPDQFHRDRRRLNRLLGTDWLVLHVTAKRLRDDVDGSSPNSATHWPSATPDLAPPPRPRRPPPRRQPRPACRRPRPARWRDRVRCCKIRATSAMLLPQALPEVPVPVKLLGS